MDQFEAHKWLEQFFSLIQKDVNNTLKNMERKYKIYNVGIPFDWDITLGQSYNLTPLKITQTNIEPLKWVVKSALFRKRIQTGTAINIRGNKIADGSGKQEVIIDIPTIDCIIQASEEDLQLCEECKNVTKFCTCNLKNITPIPTPILDRGLNPPNEREIKHLLIDAFTSKEYGWKKDQVLKAFEEKRSEHPEWSLDDYVASFLMMGGGLSS